MMSAAAQHVIYHNSRKGFLPMDAILFLIPIALGLGLLGLGAFLWSMKSGQFDDLDGAANRILFDDDSPLPDKPRPDKPMPQSNDDGSNAPPPSTK
jgi:cbb3-type cytochrome oxidase maturation protein